MGRLLGLGGLAVVAGELAAADVSAVRASALLAGRENVAVFILGDRDGGVGFAALGVGAIDNAHPAPRAALGTFVEAGAVGAVLRFADQLAAVLVTLVAAHSALAPSGGTAGLRAGGLGPQDHPADGGADEQEADEGDDG